MNIHTFFRKVFSVTIVVVLLIIGFIMGKFIYDTHRFNKRLSSELNSQLELIRTENNKLVGQSKVIGISIAQLESFYPELYQQIKRMEVKPSRVQSLSNTGIKLEKTIITTLRDSIIQDTIQVKQFSYSDAWINIRGESIGDKQTLKISHLDTISQFVFKGTRANPWLWIFSPRRLTQRISFASPYSQIQYSKYIQINEN